MLTSVEEERLEVADKIIELWQVTGQFRHGTHSPMLDEERNRDCWTCNALKRWRDLGGMGAAARMGALDQQMVHALEGIADQFRKEQYLNVLARLNELQKEVLRRFSKILKQ